MVELINIKLEKHQIKKSQISKIGRSWRKVVYKAKKKVGQFIKFVKLSSTNKCNASNWSISCRLMYNYCGFIEINAVKGGLAAK